MTRAPGLNDLNERVAATVTHAFGSMWTAYLFFAVPLLAIAAPANVRSGIFFLSSGWIQLWALPTILIGTRVLGRASEDRARESYELLHRDLASGEKLEVATELLLQMARNEIDDRQALITQGDAIAAALEELHTHLTRQQEGTP